MKSDPLRKQKQILAEWLKDRPAIIKKLAKLGQTEYQVDSKS